MECEHESHEEVGWHRCVDCGWVCPIHRTIHAARPNAFDPARPIQTAIPWCPECGRHMLYACQLRQMEMAAALDFAAQASEVDVETLLTWGRKTIAEKYA